MPESKLRPVIPVVWWGVVCVSALKKQQALRLETVSGVEECGRIVSAQELVLGKICGKRRSLSQMLPQRHVNPSPGADEPELMHSHIRRLNARAQSPKSPYQVD